MLFLKSKPSINQGYKILILLLVPIFSFAQRNFKQGYIVALNGDTLHGTIDYKNWEQNPKSILFKNNSGNINTYNTANIVAFGINNLGYYKRFIMPVSMDEIDINHLSAGIDTTKITDTVLLKIITGGKNITLYNYTDKLKTRYIVTDSKSASPVELLRYIFTDKTTLNQVINNNYYRNQLSKYAENYGVSTPSLIDQIQKSDYNYELIEIVNKINGDEANKTTGQSKSGSRFFIGANVSYETLQYYGSVVLAGAKNNTAYVPGISLGVDFIPNVNADNLYLRGELSFSTATFNPTSSASFGIVTSKSLQHLQQNAITFSPQLFYNVYNVNTSKIFLATGVDIDYFIYSSNVTTTHYSTGAADLIQPNFPGMRTIGLHVPIKAGITIKNKMLIYAEYGFQNIITKDYSGLSGGITSIQLGVNYLFGIK